MGKGKWGLAGRAAAFLGVWALLCAAARAEEVAVSTAAAAADEEPVYVFTPSARDPFVPLAGGSEVDLGGGGADKEPGVFNPSSLELKGILRTRTGRWAMLSGPGGGDRYIVENGKVLDSKKKPVKGYVGIIKEKTLVLIGPNNQVTELKLKRDQQDEKTKPQ